MKWILISKNKPQLHQIVLGLIKGKIPVIVKFSGDCFTEDGLEVKNITHWVTIPSTT